MRPDCPIKTVMPGIWVCLLLWVSWPASAAEYLAHTLFADRLEIHSDIGALVLRFHTPNAIEAAYAPEGLRQLPSFTIATVPAPVGAELEQTGASLVYRSTALAVHIRKSPLRLEYRNAEGKVLLREEAGLFAHDSRRGFRFELQGGEKLLGGGQRVLGMDRRGQRLPLYNKAHYGYETHSRQMYFSLPMVLSSQGYLLLFDNSARGVMDLGKTEHSVMEFSANGGRTAYLVFSGESYPDIIENYVEVSGRQPLPARWTLGSFASRFGYRTQAEVLEVLQRYREMDFPLDALVLDLYWFGAEIQGHMGRLDWDRKAFPDPEAMLRTLKAAGVRSILVTEPFILTTSSRWQEAVNAVALATDLAGRPKTFDFYFGNTGLIDVFKPAAMDWFYGIYRGLAQQGVDGWWGDLGEPEVHPRDAIHVNGSADSVHNAYGHQWAGGLYQRLLKDQPQTRPFIMMRAGAPGSQRFGMVPWTGDVARSWGGLQPQVELALQMGLMGLGWTHSDLGGFAGGKRFNRELYVRWLQYGVFQPVFRPHAQDNIPAEPVFHDRKTRDLLRNHVKLRYRMMPYNYTLAWENSRTGMPLMRPLFFEDPANLALIDRTDAYLWGDALLVRPITAPGLRRIRLDFPKGRWFDFFNGRRYDGGQVHEIRLHADHIPVFVRAGSFIPMVKDFNTTRDYSSAKLELHYWADASVSTGRGQMYEDDGVSRAALTGAASELLEFTATQSPEKLRIELRRRGSDYAGRPQQREVELVIHGWQGREPADRHDRQDGTIRRVLLWQGDSLVTELR